MRNLAFFLWPVLLTATVQHAPFFWDSVQLGSKHAHFFFENGLRFLPLPTEIDSGHPPIFGFYLAAIWTIFGKNLPASHWAMLPFLLGIVWLLLRLGRRLGGADWMFWLLPIVLLDPVAAGQMAMISPDVALLFFFLLAIEALFSEKKGWLALAVAGLCLISMRGMMAAAGLFAWSIVQKWLEIRHLPKSNWPRQTSRWLFDKGLFFVPGFLAAGAFLVWHFQKTGWIGHHPGSPWAPAFESVGVFGFLKNCVVLGWRWLDFGRAGEWGAIFLLAKWVQNRQDPAQNRPLPWLALVPDKRWLALFAVLLFFLIPSALIYHNLSAHRYFLPLFVLLHLLVFSAICRADLMAVHKQVLLAGLVLTMFLGNLLRNPVGVSMDWDATLAHLPYHDLRREMLAFLEAEKIDFQRVGSAFPNLNTGENLQLDGDHRQFAAKNLAENDYVLWSNVFNDFSKSEFDTLSRNWTCLKKLERGRVKLYLFVKS